jgi:hypothetical protein
MSSLGANPEKLMRLTWSLSRREATVAEISGPATPSAGAAEKAKIVANTMTEEVLMRRLNEGSKRLTSQHFGTTISTVKPRLATSPKVHFK